MKSRVTTLTRHAFLLLLFSTSPMAVAVTVPPARSFVRTDAPPQAAIFDPAHKVVYASVPSLNQVVVISTSQHAITARIPVPRAFGMDLSPDGTRLVVGSGSTYLGDYSSQYITLIDTATLQIVDRVLLPRVNGLGGQDLAPAVPVWTSNGTLLIIVRDPQSTYSNLVQWDPAKNSFRVRNIPGSGYAQQITRSGDHSKAVVQTSDHCFLYDAATDDFVATGPAAGWAAVNSDGTQFAMEDVDKLVFMNASLNSVTTLVIDAPYGGTPFFSADGRLLFVPQFITQHYYPGAYVVYDTTTFMPKGEMPAFYTPTGFDNLATMQGIDDLNEYFGVLDRGVVFYNFPIVNSLTQPFLKLPGALDPSSGSMQSPAPTNLAGSGFATENAVFFGNRAGTGVNVLSSTLMSVNPPSSTTPGPADVVVETPDGGASIAPDGYTYGPTVLYLQNNAGSTAGGTNFQVIGYGLGFDPWKMSLAVGGASANISASTSSNLMSPFMLPMRPFDAVSPPGSPGPKDITVTTPAGTTTLKNGFFYYTMSNPAGPAATGQMVFDPVRRVLYVTDDTFNQVDIFDPDTGQVVGSFASSLGPAGIALTPDASTLIVANWQSQSVSVIDVASGSHREIPVNLNGQGAGTLYPETVGAANNGKVFVGLVDIEALDGGKIVELDLSSSQMVLPPFPYYQASSDIELHSFLAGAKVLIGSGTGGGSSMGQAVIYDAATDSFKPFVQRPFHDSSITEDGQVIALGGAFYTPLGNNYSFRAPFDLTRFRYTANGEKLHPGGGLFFKPEVSPTGALSIGLYDVHSGALLRQIGMPGKALSTVDATAMDDTGDHLFVSTQSGIVVIDLAPLPLSIGSVAPGFGSPAGGDTLTIRGSNFQSGAQASLGGVNVQTTFVDENTLHVVTPPASPGPVAVRVKNPDGGSYTLAAGFEYVASIPAISTTDPTTVLAQNYVALSVFGSGFQQGAVIQWNGTAVTTTFVDNETLQAGILATLVGTVAGTAQVTVVNPGGATSNTAVITITAPSGNLGLYPDTYVFLSQLVGTTSIPVDISASNYGGGTLNNVSFSTTGNFGQTNNCPSSLAVGETCTVSLTFSPTATGVVAGTLVGTSDANSVTVKMQGRGIPPGPALTSSPFSVNFEPAWVGSTSPPLYGSVAVSSVGTSAATISSVTADGDFQVSQNSCPASLAVGEVCNISIAFVPTTNGTRGGHLRVASNAADSPLVVPLSGTGVQPLTFTPAGLDFGSVLVFANSTKQITVQNSTSSVAGLTGVGSMNPNFQVTSSCAQNIYPGTTCVITVTFAPLQVGDVSSMINTWVKTGTQQANYQFTLKGTGAANFQLALPSGASSTATVHRGNTARYSLNLVDQGFAGAVALGCGGQPALTLCNVVPASINLSGTMVQAVTVSVDTIAPSSSHIGFGRPPSPWRPGIFFPLFLIQANLAAGWLFRDRRRRLARSVAFGLIVLALCGALSCGGGSGAGGGGGGGTGGTVPGTYSFLVTATSAGVTSQVSLTLIVQ